MGSTLALTDTNGNVVAQYAYGPYGEDWGYTGSVQTAFTFIGGQGVYREANDLYHMKARYYDASLKRFLSSDPIGLAGGGNLYSYADANPVMFADPLGLFTFRVSSGIQLGAGGGGEVFTGWAIGVNTQPGVPFRERFSLGRIDTAGGGIVGGAAAFGGLQFGLSLEAQHVSELAGLGVEIGGSAGEGILSLGVSAAARGLAPTRQPATSEIQFNIGPGVGGEVHGFVTETYVGVVRPRAQPSSAGNEPYVYEYKPSGRQASVRPSK